MTASLDQWRVLYESWDERYNNTLACLFVWLEQMNTFCSSVQLLLLCSQFEIWLQNNGSSHQRHTKCNWNAFFLISELPWNDCLTVTIKSPSSVCRLLFSLMNWSGALLTLKKRYSRIRIHRQLTLTVNKMWKPSLWKQACLKVMCVIFSMLKHFLHLMFKSVNSLTPTATSRDQTILEAWNAFHLATTQNTLATA